MARYRASGSDGYDVVDEAAFADLAMMVAEIDRRAALPTGCPNWVVTRNDGIEVGVRDEDEWTWWNVRRAELREKARVEGLTHDEWAEVLGEERWATIVEAEWSGKTVRAAMVLNVACRAGFVVPTVYDEEEAG